MKKGRETAFLLHKTHKPVDDTIEHVEEGDNQEKRFIAHPELYVQLLRAVIVVAAIQIRIGIPI